VLFPNRIGIAAPRSDKVQMPWQAQYIHCETRKVSEGVEC
jgi:hypothetical protein